ncbi:hypothetical protein AU467_34175 [Mesorhizobium loti]|uniref:Integrase catalytic domain-containing protein n=1 Tax=Rhizobium loti TaxID=381 RepID=A0A101KLX2_RHILI|nr:hypothetical protein AU467_34175 [Mesorhizobium loti]
MERNGHLKLEEEIRHKILSMSAATIDRLLQMPRRTGRTKKPRVVPEPRRRIKMRTFADWNEPLPGSMEMDLVAHCGQVNRGSYVHSLVLTDIASGWTEAAPIVVREGVVETLARIRLDLPFALTALDVDNGTEFVNNKLIEYCLGHGIELTRARPYRKNDQAWIEQKNGAVVRKLLGYRRFECLAAARAITRLYGASRLFVNFFQPSFKLAAKQRDGAKVAKRYHPPQTPCERLLQAESVPMATKNKLREIAAHLDPLKLLEEMRAVQAYLAALADGEMPPPATSDPPNLAAFMASLSSAWHAGDDPSDILHRSKTALSAKPPKGLNTSSYCESVRRAQAGDPTRDRSTASEDIGEAKAGLRRTWPRPNPGAPHGVADRVSPIGGIPQHQRHAALRRVMHPVSRSIYPQAIQNVRPTGQCLAPGSSRAWRCHRA